MADPEYFLRDGEVWFRRSTTDEIHICGGSEMLSVAIETNEGVLHKHGHEPKVSAWADAHRQKFAAHPELADFFNVEIVTFPINQEVLDEFNRCIATSGRIAGFVDFLQKQSADDFGPSYPS